MTWSEHEPVAGPEAEAAGSGTEGAESRISAGLTELDGLGSRPLAEHAPAYEGLHEQLQSVLAEIDGA